MSLQYDLPTNVILGVATIFLVAVGAVAVIDGLLTGFVVGVVVGLPAGRLLEVLDETTTGSVDGMGFPNFVCNFSTCQFGRKISHEQHVPNLLEFK